MAAAEATAHVNEMVTVYEGDKLETESMTLISQIMVKNMTTHVEEGERLKSVIKALIEDFGKAQEELDETRRNCRIEEEITQIETENQRAKRRDEELKSQINETNTRRDVLRKEVEKIKALHKEAHATLRQGDLYNTVAQIRWQHDEESPNMVKGTVVNRSGVRPFSLDVKQQSKNFICNYVWDLMEVDW